MQGSIACSDPIQPTPHERTSMKQKLGFKKIRVIHSSLSWSILFWLCADISTKFEISGIKPFGWCNFVVRSCNLLYIHVQFGLSPTALRCSSAGSVVAKIKKLPRSAQTAPCVRKLPDDDRREAAVV